MTDGQSKLQQATRAKEKLANPENRSSTLVAVFNSAERKKKVSFNFQPTGDRLVVYFCSKVANNSFRACIYQSN